MYNKGNKVWGWPWTSLIFLDFSSPLLWDDNYTISNLEIKFKYIYPNSTICFVSVCQYSILNMQSTQCMAFQQHLCPIPSQSWHSQFRINLNMCNITDSHLTVCTSSHSRLITSQQVSNDYLLTILFFYRCLD